MYLVTNRLMEIVIINFSILINIEFVKYVFELFFCRIQPPVSEIEPKLIFSYRIISLLIDIRESLSDSLPLCFDLFDDGFLKNLIQ